jgi:ribonucleoside-diphosphate reductase alpha chain
MDAFATSISIALQYNVPLEDLCNKFSHMRFEPNGFTNNRQIPIAKSIMDYIFRYLSLKFLGRTKEPPKETKSVSDGLAEALPAADMEQIDMFEEGAAPDQLVGDTVEAFLQATGETSEAIAVAEIDPSTNGHSTFNNQEDAPPCSNCGSITVRSGSCYSCPNCGATSGCG